MYKVNYLNKISPVGTKLLTDQYTAVEDMNEADAVLVRSAAMHDLAFSENLLAIARAGAGVNNIPLDRCADEGIVVFNTPGANANGVKELAICGLLLGSLLLRTGNWRIVIFFLLKKVKKSHNLPVFAPIHSHRHIIMQSYDFLRRIPNVNL